MLRKDNIWLGFSLGLILPAIPFIYYEILKRELTLFGKHDIFYLLSIAINLIVIRYYFKAQVENTARGLVLSTFACTILFFILKRYR